MVRMSYPDAFITALIWVELEATRRGLLSIGLWFEILSVPQVEAVDLLCRSDSLSAALSRCFMTHGDTEELNGCGGATLLCVRTNLSTSHVSIWTAHQRDNKR